MLVQLTEEQVTEYWTLISQALVASAPPNVDLRGDYLSDILESLLLGRMKAWVVTDEKKIYILGVTGISVDEVLQQRNLIIYSIYSIGGLSNNLWAESLRQLRKYATAQKCRAIVGFTNVPKIVHIAKKLGMDASVTLIKMEV